MASQAIAPLASQSLTEPLIPHTSPLPHSPCLDFLSVLETLEKQEVPTILLPIRGQETKSLTAFTVCGKEVVVGLESGEVLSASFFPTPSVTQYTPKEAHHTGKVTRLVSVAGGTIVVSASEDATLKVWSVTEHSALGTLKGHTEAVRWAAVTPDEKFCVSVADDEAIKLWSLESFSEIATDKICSKMLELTPSGKLCLCATSDNSIVVWGLQEQKAIATLHGHKYEISRIAISIDEQYCFSGDTDGCVKVWSLESLREVASFTSSKGRINDIVVTPNNKLCISASSDCNLTVWSVTDRHVIAILKGHINTVRALAVAPDSRICLSASDEYTIKLWSLDDFREIANLKGHSDNVTYVGTADGRNFVSGSDDNTLKLWSVMPRNDSPILTHSDAVESLVVTPKFVVSGSADRTVQVWSRDAQRLEATFAGHEDTVSCVKVTPDEQYCVSASWSPANNLKLWSLASMSEVADLAGHSDCVYDVAVTDDGKLCVSASSDLTLKVWAIASRSEVATLKGHTGGVNCIAVTSDSTRVVSGSGDGTVKLWSLETCTLEATMEGHTKEVTAIAVTSDGKYCCSGATDETVKLWSLLELREVASFPGNTGYIYRLRLSPDDKRCFSMCDDKSIKVLDLEQRREVATFSGHAGIIYDLAITSNGEFCVSGDASDGQVVLWDLKQLRKLKTIAHHMEKVWRVALSPDDQFCVSCTESGRVYLHPLNQLLGRDQSEPTPIEFIANIEALRSGAPVCKLVAMLKYPARGINSLHISAYFSYADRLQEYLEMGVPIIRGDFGSALTVALRNRDVVCVDVILRHLINLVTSIPGDEQWPTFAAINDDIMDLLSSGASQVTAFFEIVMQSPDHRVGKFITPVEPMTRHIENRYVDSALFQDPNSQADSILVAFSISLLSLNTTFGSQSSIQFLTALAACSDKTVLKSPFVSTILQEKWSHCYPFTLGLTLAYALLLVALTTLVFAKDLQEQVRVCVCGTLLAVNGFFLLFECVQAVTSRADYFADLWNYVDIIRGILCALWGAEKWSSGADTRWLTLCVVMLCFLRGFTYFRSFQMTRVFVHLTMEVVKEMYSFLVILGYSVLAFGIFSAIIQENEPGTLAEAWTSAFNLVMGAFDNNQFNRMQWAVFISAGIVNVVIMMNLLISILGKAYEKTQMSIVESDLLQQLTLILEYEHLFYWRRNLGYPTVLVTCMRAQDVSSSEEWSAKVLQNTSMLQKYSVRLDEKMTLASQEMTQNFESVGEKLGTGFEGVQERIRGMQEEASQHIATIEAKAVQTKELVNRMEDNLTNSVGRMNDVEDMIKRIDEKVTTVQKTFDGRLKQVEEKLEAILTLLQSRG